MTLLTHLHEQQLTFTQYFTLNVITNRFSLHEFKKRFLTSTKILTFVCHGCTFMTSSQYYLWIAVIFWHRRPFFWILLWEHTISLIISTSSFKRVRGATKAPKGKLDPFYCVIIGKKGREFNNMVEKQGLMSILKPHAVFAILVSVSKTTVGLLQVCTYFCWCRHSCKSQCRGTFKHMHTHTPTHTVSSLFQSHGEREA